MRNTTAWSAYADIRVEFGVGESYSASTIGLWSSGHWGDQGDAIWSGSEPLWVDVTDHMRHVSTAAGVDYSIGRFQTGTAQLVADNVDGWATLFTPNELDIRVRRSVRVLGVARSGPAAGTEWPIFRGVIDGMAPTYLADGRPGVQFDCVDALALFAADDPLELDPPVGGNELSGARVHRILDRVGFPPVRRHIATGQVRMLATNMARNYADELGVTADSEGGSLYVDLAGFVTFHDRDWWRLASPTTRFTIGNVAEADVCPSSWEVTSSMAEIVSLVALSNAGGTVRNYRDAATFAAVGPATYRRFDLICADEGQLDVLAGRILEVRGGARARVRGCSLSLLAEGLALVDMLSGYPAAPLAFGDRLLASYVDPSGGPDRFDLPMLVTRIGYRVAADGDFEVELGLEDAAPYTPALGWGIARWAIDAWTSASLAGELEQLEAELAELAATIGAPA